MKVSDLRQLIREEVRKALKEAISPEEMEGGIGLPYDNGKMAGKFVQLANKMGLTQGTWNNGDPNGDYSFDYEMGDVNDEGELVDERGRNSEGNNPSAIFILNPAMQTNAVVQELVQAAMDEYED